MRRPDLPGPTENDCWDGQAHPLCDERQTPDARRNVRDEVVAALAANNGEFNWDPLFTTAAIDAARAAPLHQPKRVVPPLPSLAPIGAQGVAGHFIGQPCAGYFNNAAVRLDFQDQTRGDANINPAPAPAFLDNPFGPPANAPAFRLEGAAAPDIFCMDESDDVFDLGLGDRFVLDMMNDVDNAVVWDDSLNFAETPAAGVGDETYGGGMDFHGVLHDIMDYTAGGAQEELQYASAARGPNDILAVDNKVWGEGRPPTSPLPIAGPMFPLNEPIVGVFGTQAWQLDFFPAGAFDEIAGLTVPSKSIDYKRPDEGTLALNARCGETNLDGTDCTNPVIARCVDR